MEAATLIPLGVALVTMLLGGLIWRFKWIHLLNNVRVEDVDPAKKGELARFAGRMLLVIGGILALLSLAFHFITTEQRELIAVFMAVSGIFVTTGFYLKGLERYLKK